MKQPSHPEETSMARTGSTNTTPARDEGEPVVDFMADAPAERPYSEAVSDAQRALLAGLGLPVPEPGTE
jgi:hypothetical protein